MPRPDDAALDAIIISFRERLLRKRQERDWSAPLPVEEAEIRRWGVGRVANKLRRREQWRLGESTRHPMWARVTADCVVLRRRMALLTKKSGWLTVTPQWIVENVKVTVK